MWQQSPTNGLGSADLTRTAPIHQIEQRGTKCRASILAVLLLAGCGSTDLLKTQQNLATGGADVIAAIPIPAFDGEPAGSPTEIYTRIGRGAGICWFGTNGQLKATHIFHADAEPPSRGGKAEIVIHEKDTAMPNPRGNRAFRVQIAPSGENASIDIENVRFPIDVGQTMTADVRRWARNDITCNDKAQTKGWDAQTAPPAPTAPAKPPVKQRDRKV